ncbi:cell wall-active antibiotics response protein LiaF [Salisediminibacterium beveridgei]|uniref:Transporter associated with VraSR n=1 Tax=Salisediminibacterium beveridgei TaxID=632773 RepID=A0A1D7QTJ9_9BACI|nr:cell wall-active antibiotics response protein LiaF [Salisediminibacterium beveridgei]AOM82341.1 Transporter associated with VraSR [Salisediminibacterium beveridgei]
MLRRVPAKTMNAVILIAIAILLVELAVKGGDVIIPGIIFGFLIYLGWKNFHSLFGKIIFFIGILAFFGNVFSLVAVQFLLLALIVLFFKYVILDKEEEAIRPVFTSDEMKPGITMNKRPLLRQKVFGSQRVGEEPYSWRDVNIHGGFGDRTIDLSQTVLPDEAVISIRHLFGNITIYVPYEVDVTVHHSTMFGQFTVFEESGKLVNESVSYRNLSADGPHVKIVTSLLSGDLEVRRI